MVPRGCGEGRPRARTPVQTRGADSTEGGPWGLPETSLLEICYQVWFINCRKRITLT